MHALIIEDEPIIALLIEDRLAASGCTSVDFAVTEAEAVAAAERRPPDLVTADVRLAAGCGIAAVEAICRRRPVTVLFLTASGWEVLQRLPHAVVVPKPFAAATLDRALAEARRPLPAHSAH
ncbi:MAG TPA: response regulator [Allosphingosinicella sp.]|nr:response regulator [Allosphingosinicella sp.]